MGNAYNPVANIRKQDTPTQYTNITCLFQRYLLHQVPQLVTHRARRASSWTQNRTLVQDRSLLRPHKTRNNSPAEKNQNYLQLSSNSLVAEEFPLHPYNGRPVKCVTLTTRQQTSGKRPIAIVSGPNMVCSVTYFIEYPSQLLIGPVKQVPEHSVERFDRMDPYSACPNL